MDLSRFKIHFIDIDEALCKRPKVYTMNGTFGEITAYIEGYANGKRFGPKGRSGSYFNSFYRWLALNLPEDYSRMEELITSQIHEDALREFARLYRLYENSEGSPEQKEKAL